MISQLRERRSIRKFKKIKIEEPVIDILKEALLRSPSSRNKNPWKFIFVDDFELLTKLSKSKKHGSAYLGNTSLGVVICGDETITDVWVEDCSVATIILQLAAQSLGLGSCWCQIRNRKHNDSISAEDYVKQLLNIPEQIKVEAIVGMGYPDEEPTPHPKSNLDYGKIYLNGYL